MQCSQKHKDLVFQSTMGCCNNNGPANATVQRIQEKAIQDAAKSVQNVQEDILKELQLIRTLLETLCGLYRER